MATARAQQISLADTPYYHIVSRCVRRSYLCGTDELTGQCYQHRRAWIEDRIRLLATVFSIDICSYAVMSNHYHIVVKIDAATSKSWSFDEVIQRWLCIHKGPFLIQKYQKEKRFARTRTLHFNLFRFFWPAGDEMCGKDLRGHAPYILIFSGFFGRRVMRWTPRHTASQCAILRSVNNQ